MSENQIKEEIEKIGYKEFYRYYKEKDILLHQQQQELDQYKNNWEELKKWVKEKEQHYSNDECPKEIKYEFLRISNEYTKILNKMKELEEDNNGD